MKVLPSARPLKMMKVMIQQQMLKMKKEQHV
jgi:hypothetical protein